MTKHILLLNQLLHSFVFLRIALLLQSKLAILQRIMLHLISHYNHAPSFAFQTSLSWTNHGTITQSWTWPRQVQMLQHASTHTEQMSPGPQPATPASRTPCCQVPTSPSMATRRLSRGARRWTLGACRGTPSCCEEQMLGVGLVESSRKLQVAAAQTWAS